MKQGAGEEKEKDKRGETMAIVFFIVEFARKRVTKNRLLFAEENACADEQEWEKKENEQEEEDEEGRKWEKKRSSLSCNNRIRKACIVIFESHVFPRFKDSKTRQHNRLHIF